MNEAFKSKNWSQPGSAINGIIFKGKTCNTVGGMTIEFDLCKHSPVESLILGHTK